MPVDFTCPHCGHRTFVGDEYIGLSGPCAGCGRNVTVLSGPGVRLPRGAGTAGPEHWRRSGAAQVLPVGRSGWAVAAGYAGLFSVLCFPAPLALLLGIVAIRDIRRHPTGTAWAGPSSE